MIYRKITFARVRMLVLTCLILLGVFGQLGGQQTEACLVCESKTCPEGPGPCFQGQLPWSCLCYRYNGALTKCTDIARK